ncbi:MBL fold metallo-hydrolase [Psychrobacillus sp. FSL H8-0484]|uniref:MBL fold metallo-hydrolase n=1 Tax=Psychrobacillus sp. FSL H8-0484 TaxID=2921390 RepID=UPI0030FC155D
MMKAKRVSEHIWSLNTWMIVPIHVWVVVEEDGVTLVDAGMPIMAKGIMKFLKELNFGPLQRILLTHGHVDHVGAIKAILTENEVPVYVHQKEIPYMEGELLYPKRKKLEQNVEKGIAKALAEDELGNLKKIGSLTPFWTPGHSPGHVVYYHEKDQVLLAGDLFSSKKGKLRPPLFTPEIAEAVKSSSIVGTLNPKRLEVCHGNTVYYPANQLEEYVGNMEKKLGATEFS